FLQHSLKYPNHCPAPNTISAFVLKLPFERLPQFLLLLLMRRPKSKSQAVNPLVFYHSNLVILYTAFPSQHLWLEWLASQLQKTDVEFSACHHPLNSGGNNTCVLQKMGHLFSPLIATSNHKVSSRTTTTSHHPYNMEMHNPAAIIACPRRFGLPHDHETWRAHISKLV